MEVQVIIIFALLALVLMLVAFILGLLVGKKL